ncbi:hypothetical protein PM082_022466 [Marasmius tenuissimus]|nr:hypothetical protein PM082_022466 [Marasmius tenuissimus]
MGDSQAANNVSGLLDWFSFFYVVPVITLVVEGLLYGMPAPRHSRPWDLTPTGTYAVIFVVFITLQRKRKRDHRRLQLAFTTTLFILATISLVLTITSTFLDGRLLFYDQLAKITNPPPEPTTDAPLWSGVAYDRILHLKCVLFGESFVELQY